MTKRQLMRVRMDADAKPWAAAIRRLRKVLRMNQAELGEELGVSQSTVTRWERGAEPSLENFAALRAFAQRHGHDMPDHGWFDSGAQQPGVPILGYVGAGAEIHPIDDQGAVDHAPYPPGASAKTSAVIVRGDSMLPKIDDGWLLYYDERRRPSDDLIGELCVVWLEDGRALVKRLYRSRETGKWDLHSMRGDIIKGVSVGHAAMVTWIKPRPR